MRIFGERVVVGLFDNAKDAEKAVTDLDEHGFSPQSDDKIEVIDQTNLEDGIPIDKQGEGEGVAVPPPTGTAGPVGPVTPTKPVEIPEADAQSIEVSVKDKLTNWGVDEEEADYFARQAARGNTLIVVETSKDQASKALDILEKANARGAIS